MPDARPPQPGSVIVAHRTVAHCASAVTYRARDKINMKAKLFKIIWSMLMLMPIAFYIPMPTESTTLIPDCPRNEGWTCEWDVDYWKATSNVSSPPYDKLIITQEESPTRRVTIICSDNDDDEDDDNNDKVAPESKPSSVLNYLPVGFLKNFTLGETTYFRFLHCRPPSFIKENGAILSLGKILDGQTVKKLRFTGREALGDALDSTLFDELLDLTYLSLAGNSLTSISRKIFERMPNLEAINIKDNQLTTLPANAFESIRSLVHLDAGNNNLTRLDEPVLGLRHLQTLNVYQNQIETVSAEFFASTPSLRSVDLQGNLLQSLPTGVFEKLTELRTLRLFSNRLTNLPSDLLRPLRHLERFDVSDNPRLGSLPGDVLQNLTTDTLSEVNFRRCGLNNLSPGLFDNCPSLRILQIDWNNLTVLEAGTFVGAKNLRILDLRRNHIEVIPSRAFDSLSRLVTLHLNRNLIRQISPSAFYDMASLLHVDLSRNRLTEIPDDLFKPTVNLEMLNLGRNMLSNVHRGPTTFTLPHTIRTLDLQHNRFTGLPSAWITENTWLVRLDLSHNRLRRFDSSDCQPTSDNVTIDLRHNSIERVFVDLQWATILAEMNNQARSRSSKLQTPVVLLGNNPILCDCLAANLLEYVYGDLHQFLVTLDITDLECRGPFKLDGKQVASLQLEQLVCQERNDCPRNCLCQKHAVGNFVEMDCRSLNLTEWPTMAPFNVSVLRLDNNSLTSILQDEQDNFNLTTNRTKSLWENLTEIHLSSNNIDSVDNLVWLPNRLRLLNLRNNSIEAIGDNVLNLFDNSTSIARATSTATATATAVTEDRPVRGKIRYSDFDQGFDDDQSDLEVWLEDNPWRCDCGARPLKEWLNVNGKRAGNLSAIRCVDYSDTKGNNNNNNINNKNVPLFKATICPGESTRMLVHSKEMLIGATVVSVAMAIVLAMAGIGYYRYKREIKVWLYAHQWCMWFVTETELDREKTYDAFISFSQEDSEFVASQLLPGLEGRTSSSSKYFRGQSSTCKEQFDSGISISSGISIGSSIEHPHIHKGRSRSHTKNHDRQHQHQHQHHHHHNPSYKVCIHYRDWLAGEWISEQIIRSVQDSRRTIVVLSKNFIKSVWGRLEFKAAHHQALQDRTNRIIIIVYGELPSIAEMDAELNMYVKFNTYLRWDDPWFWEKLRYAMPHRPLSKNGNRDNVSVCTDKSTSWPSSNVALSSTTTNSTSITTQPQMTSLRSLSSSSSTSSSAMTATTTLSDISLLSSSSSSSLSIDDIKLKSPPTA